MNDQTKTMKLLYAVFLLAVTARTIVALYDRFMPEEKDGERKK